MDTLIKLAGTGISVGAVMAANKVLQAGWHKATGKDAPTKPGDNDDDTIKEILIWAVLTTVVSTAIKFGVAKTTQRASRSMRDPREV
ncbi:hypothetical protein BKD30_02880 [Tersicoccus phoenicis]|uniref:DUF4235 domain-containing protein n=1 Tax=Tersicoccus phoenicis TaxID=554083 RepID=A0A1R1LJ92_9MICC|nr:DUF4235 domain-containing protein [Tersicoccus phoenicis]OMH27613.1 hypothetical protein BKD30_02880 [Tersicoccus phoenicis]